MRVTILPGGLKKIGEITGIALEDDKNVRIENVCGKMYIDIHGIVGNTKIIKEGEDEIAELVGGYYSKPLTHEEWKELSPFIKRKDNGRYKKRTKQAS